MCIRDSYKGDEWFIHTGRGAAAYIAGAGEEATIPLAAEGWLRVTGPSGRRPAQGWRHARALRLRVAGV
eukprot:452703-Alexandrium_andersonii.AAC.1